MIRRVALLPKPSLLETAAFPVEELVQLAVREGRRPRPIYSAHKWFARRLGVVFRSLLIGASSGAGADFWKAYYGGADLRHLTVLDPFVGGGTSVVEAQRLGASVAAGDVDPIACAVTRFELAAHTMPDLEEALDHLLETVGEGLRPFHEVVVEGREVQVLHHFWVQRVRCGGCSQEFDVHPNYWLSKMPGCAWAFCKACGHTQEVRDDASELSCERCLAQTILGEGTVEFGRAKCPSCSHTVRLIELGRETGAPPIWHLFAHEVLPTRGGRKAVPMVGRRFISATEESLARYHSAEACLEAGLRDGAFDVAGGPIVAAARTDTRLDAYGYRDWRDLYNARQRLHLAMLAKALGGFDGATRDALVMAFSDHLTTNCMMTSYAAGWRRLTPLFSIRGFRHVPRPIELNPWLDGTGRGTFPNAVRKLLRAREFARSPKEPEAQGGFRSVKAVTPGAEARVRAGSSKDLSFLEDASVDVVLTDPPYFDNIAYSELAEFFLPWLRRFGVVVDEGVDRVLLDSLVSRRTNAESITAYTEGLGVVFGEVARVLKPDGMMVFSYRHLLPSAWVALAQAIAPHPLDCVRVLPLPGEAGTGLHAHEGAGLWDAVFVFRRRAHDTRQDRPLVLSHKDIADAEAATERWSTALAPSAIRFAVPDRRTVSMALLVGAALVREPQTAGVELATALDDAIEWARRGDAKLK